MLENGRVKVMDFGIAKLKDQESQLTQTGMALGTVAYMSPEQLRGEKIDHRVDIFSYGVLAYEMLAGQRPFRAETISTLFYQLLHEPPPPLDLPHLPPELVAVVDRCLAKAVAERYQTFDEVLVALDQVAAEITGAEDQRPEDLYRPDEQSEAESSAHRLAAKAQRSIDAGDLTAAAMTLNMARREVDHATFERVFAGVLSAFQELEKRQAVSATSGPRLGDIEQLLSEVELKLLADDYQGAETALGRLESVAQNDNRVRALRQRFSAALASRPTSPGAAERPEPPPPASASGASPIVVDDGPTIPESRGLGRLPLAIAASTVGVAIVGMLVWVIFSGGGSAEGGADGEAEEPVEQTAVPGAGTSTASTAGDAGTTDPPGGGSELPTGPGATGTTDTVTDEPPTQTQSTESTQTGGTSTKDPPTQTSSTKTTEPPGIRDTTPGGQTRTGGTTDTRTTQPTDRRPPVTDTRTVTPPDRRGSDTGGTTVTPPSTRDPGDSRPGTGSSGNVEPPADERKTETRQADPPPSNDPPTVAPPTVNISDLREQDAIRRTLTAYQSAWKSLDHEAINLIHPNSGVTRRDVRLYRIADVSFSDCTFRINGDTATATCRVTRTLEPRSGAPQVERFNGFRLLKQGSGWVVDGLVPGG